MALCLWVLVGAVAACQALLFPSPGLTAPAPLQPHREVIVNAEHEALLPADLTNPFYKNPRIAEALARESWLGPGEMHVANRETDNIPRHRIFSVLRNAGLARRRR